MPRSTAAATIAIAISLGLSCTGDFGGVGDHKCHHRGIAIRLGLRPVSAQTESDSAGSDSDAAPASQSRCSPAGIRAWPARLPGLSRAAAVGRAVLGGVGPSGLALCGAVTTSWRCRHVAP